MLGVELACTQVVMVMLLDLEMCNRLFLLLCHGRVFLYLW